jgi:hypothetical protein
LDTLLRTSIAPGLYVELWSFEGTIALGDMGNITPVASDLPEFHPCFQPGPKILGEIN